MKNPFKFGTVVEEPFFTDREDELSKVKSILDSENHLIIISPRRYGKTSLINKVIKSIDRPNFTLDLQLITGPEDFSAQLLKRIYKTYPAQKIRNFIKNFRVIPSVSLNPITNEIDISFRASSSEQAIIEDVFELIEKLSHKDIKPIVVFDEFQEIKRIRKDFDKKLRSILQHHKNINYVFLGSSESLIRDIFEKKKSSFYHFGFLLSLAKIPETEFLKFLKKNFKKKTGEYDSISKEIIDVTKCHPYYTQQLAFTVWELINRNTGIKDPVQFAITEIIEHHDVDYERLWNTLNNIDMKILIGMSFSDYSPLSDEFSKQYNTGATSTSYSSLKRLLERGMVVKTISGYEIDDPFFKNWIQVRRHS